MEMKIFERGSEGGSARAGRINSDLFFCCQVIHKVYKLLEFAILPLNLVTNALWPQSGVSLRNSQLF